MTAAVMYVRDSLILSVIACENSWIGLMAWKEMVLLYKDMIYSEWFDLRDLREREKNEK